MNAVFWCGGNSLVYRKKEITQFLVALDFQLMLYSLVVVQVAKWLWAKKEFKDVNLDDIMRNWDTCMKCGPHKMKSVSWYPPPHGFLKCNVFLEM